METRIEKYRLPKCLRELFYVGTNNLITHTTKDHTIGILYVETHGYETVTDKEIKKFFDKFDSDGQLKIVARTKRHESDVDNYEVALKNIKRKISKQLYKLAINIISENQKNINKEEEETLKNLNKKLNFIADKIKNS